MPTASCRRSHVGHATKDPSPPDMPQSVTISKSSSGANMQSAGIKNASSCKKKNSPKKPPPRPTLLSPGDTSKTPHSDNEKPPQLAVDRGNPVVTTAVNNSTGNISRIKSYKQTGTTGPAAAFASSKAAAPSRTKKIAKSKAKRAKVSQAKKLPKKIKKPKGSKSEQKKPIPFVKSPAICKKEGGKSTSVPSHGEKLSQGGGSSPAKNPKSKKPRKSTFPDTEPTKKRAKKRTKKLKTKDLEIKSKSKLAKSPPPLWIGNKPEPEDCIPTTHDKYSKIKNLVSPVMDAVAIGINYCSYLFCAERPKVSIGTKENCQDNTVTNPLEHKSQNISAKQTNSGLDRADRAVNRKEGAPPSAQTKSEQICKGQPLPPALLSGSDMHDVHSLTMAVNRFVLEVYCPFLLSAMKSTRTISPNPDRVRLSTILAIREMLIMNSDKLFSFSALGEPSAAGTVREQVYLSHVFANTIVQVAAKKLHSQQPEGTFLASFKQAVQDYDTKSDHFQFSLVQTDARSLYVNVNSEVVGEEESLIAKVGYNFARARHPLFHGKWSSLTSDGNAQVGVAGGKRSLSRPIPTACAVFHIEESAAYDSDEVKETAKVMESLKSVLRDTKRKRTQG